MRPHQSSDEENLHVDPPAVGPYHDDPISDDDDLTLAADAPPPRPSSDFDGLLLHPHPSHTTASSRLLAAVSARIPDPAKRAWTATKTWVVGPRPPRIFSITPVFPRIQHLPIDLLDRYAPTATQRFWLLVLLYACWLLSFGLVMRASSFAASIPGYGAPISLGCGARFWGEKNDCGLNGDLCRPFANDTLAFRCPADCRKTEIVDPHAVGDQEVNYQPLVVGGRRDGGVPGWRDGKLVEEAVYRSDSFICASAVHAGFIRESEGGCGVLTLLGEQYAFSSAKLHGIPSVGFDSYFPHSFGFLSGTRAQCKDLRWPALAVSVFFSALLALFTTSPAVFFWTSFVGLFFHVALASDPPSLTSYYDLISLALARFLPACFCAHVTYRYTARRSLTGLTAQVEKTVLWLGACWVGSLNNYTFDRIPIQRLTPHDIQAQPGAVPALIAVIAALILIALGQAWCFRVEGRMPRYLLIYGIFVAVLLLMIALPGLSLRIHHYILGLLLLPGTSFQNRPSLVYQGLLLGLFINGVARWGFASILETPAALLQGAQTGSLLPAVEVVAAGVTNITFAFPGVLPVYDQKLDVTYDGVSVLVNDVERFRGFADGEGYWDQNDGHGGGNGQLTWTWERHELRGNRDPEEEVDGAGDRESSAAAAPKGEQGTLDELPLLPEYFRFGYMSGSEGADFTKAGKWRVDGSWKEMEEGPS